MSNMRKKNAKSLRAVPGRSTRVKKNVSRRNLGLVMYKSPRTMMPEEYDTVLKYIVVQSASNNGGTLASLRFTSNAYDVDPSLGNTAMAGFAEFAAFYQRFRTIGMKYKFSAVNQENFPISVIHGFGASAITSGSLGMNYGENPLFQTYVLGAPNGQARGIFQSSNSVANIAGTATVLYDDLYTGSTTSNTMSSTGMVYCYFGIAAGQAGALTAAGCFVHVEISLHVRFFKPNLLVT